MRDFEVRPATPADLDALMDLWRQIMHERAEMDRRIQITEDAPSQWRTMLAQHLDRNDRQVLVAVQTDRLIGYIVGWILERPTMLWQQRFGFISDLGVDGHAHQPGVGSALFDAIQPWFRAHEIEVLEIEVMHHHPIAQAFWRARGATAYIDRFWYRLGQ